MNAAKLTLQQGMVFIMSVIVRLVSNFAEIKVQKCKNRKMMKGNISSFDVTPSRARITAGTSIEATRLRINYICNAPLVYGV